MTGKTRAKRGGVMRGDVEYRIFYISSPGWELDESPFLECPHLRPEFRGATDKVEAAPIVRAKFDHPYGVNSDAESTEMKIRNKKLKTEKLCVLCASVVKKLVTIGQNVAEFDKKWQKMAERYSWGQVETFHYAASKRVTKNER